MLTEPADRAVDGFAGVDSYVVVTATPAIAALRSREFARLDRIGTAYLDYTGAALYGETQVTAHHALLAAQVFGNPHAESEPSRAATVAIEDARQRVLAFLDADPDEYAVCFTANCSAAIKLVAESFPFTRSSTLLLSADNHNSINGIREYARRRRSTISYLPLDEDLRLENPEQHLARAERHRGEKLFAFPAQSNFSGVQHSLELIAIAQRFGCAVLLDVAAFTPSNPLSLRQYSPDFVTLSFYKIFGYPTGVGALVVRRDALPMLRRPWFAGGTVAFASTQNDRHELRTSIEAFEDGTPDFLAIAGLTSGFDLIDGIGMPAITAHVKTLTARMLAGLTALEHPDGAPLVRAYGPATTAQRGGTVAFNVLDRAGRVVPYAFIERRARTERIAVRGGCFCNPGAAERAFGFDRERARRCMEQSRASDFTIQRFGECLGPDVAVGAIRASVGLANNVQDVDRLLALIQSFARE